MTTRLGLTGTPTRDYGPFVRARRRGLGAAFGATFARHWGALMFDLFT